MGKRLNERVRFVACAASVGLHMLFVAGVAQQSASLDATRTDGGAANRNPLMRLQFAEPPVEAESPEQEVVIVVPPPAVPPEEVLLGAADGGDVPSENWVGFAEPTPHGGPLSTVNQPALDLQPGGGGAGPNTGEEASESRAVEPQPPLPIPQPQTEPLAFAEPNESAEPTEPTDQPSESVPMPDVVDPNRRPGPTDMPEAEREPVDEDELEQPTPTEPQTPVETEPDPLTEGPFEMPLPPAEVRDERSDERQEEREGRESEERSASLAWELLEVVGALAAELETVQDQDVASEARVEPEPVAAPMPKPEPASPAMESTAKSAAGGGEGEGGETSDKQTDASSTTPSTVVRPGHPVAARGLEIVTRRPQFSKVTRVTAVPSNPEVVATFGRNGRVVRAQMIKSSGYPDVDQPVLDAVYAWTARGEALGKIPAGDPKAGVSLKFTVLLR